MFETEAIENRRFRHKSGIRLGRRGSGVQIAPPRPIESMGWSIFGASQHPVVKGAGENMLLPLLARVIQFRLKRGF